MAVEIPGKQFSYEAAGDLSTKQFHAMKMDANGRITVFTALGNVPVGILQDKPAALGRAGCVMIDGVSKMVAGVAIDEGELVAGAADGRAKVAAANDYVMGVCVKACSAAGGIISVQFDCSNPVLKA